MKPQAIFEKVMDHLIAQGKQSKMSNGDCVYHHPEGLKCAVGVLISNHYYRAGMDNISGGFGSSCIHNILQQYKLPGFIQNNVSLLTVLQYLHDKDANWTDSGFVGFNHAKDIAETFKLDFSKYQGRIE